MVLITISIVAAVAIPAYFARSEITLENASVLLAQDLRAVQNRSAYLGQPAWVSFLKDQDGYEVIDGSGELIRNPRTDRPFERRYSQDGVFRGVRVCEVSVGKDDTLAYDELGRPLAEGKIVLEFLGDTRVLLVEKRTGKVRIVGSSSDWKDRGY
jgi:hypothetical protein